MLHVNRIWWSAYNFIHSNKCIMYVGYKLKKNNIFPRIQWIDKIYLCVTRDREKKKTNCILTQQYNTWIHQTGIDSKFRLKTAISMYIPQKKRHKKTKLRFLEERKKNWTDARLDNWKNYSVMLLVCSNCCTRKV